MRFFLTRILQFCFFLMAFALIIQLLIGLNIRNRSIRGHDNLKQTENINADLVFLGSSRCRSHFDPFFFDTAFNLKSINIGVEGHSELSMAILRLKLYLSKNKAPKFAILSFDPLVSAGKEKNDTNYIHKNDFARYAFFPNKTDLPLVEYFNYSFFEKYLPLYAILKYQLFYDCFHKRPHTFSVSGYEEHNKPADKVYSDVSDHLKDRFQVNRDIPGIKKSLGQLNDLCIKNNIKLICIQTPVYKKIYDQELFSEPGQICNELGVSFIDVNTEPIKEEKSNFYNADHMNIEGVTKMNSFLRSNKTLNECFGKKLH